ncbi:YheC/YheD family protein [Cohnella pontilimi]|uniref:YheC/YheD family protein n=1 Tax=Cohnella pontilimi TaxID=2564100 RepID=A0A4U0F9P9_9BACL|nr:YheC/YheD family protein [Cohnella pontilimi]TJY41486.1 YheC/YheD family protein [Cohnella pontilimi]
MPVICPDFKPGAAALGILVCEHRSDPPFNESEYVRRLMKTGSLAGLPVFAFAPWTWSAEDDSVNGWTWDDAAGRWVSGRRPVPAVLYDRAWPADREERFRFRLALRRMVEGRRLVQLNAKLPHKKLVYDVLYKDEQLAPLLPPTELYGGPDSLRSWLHRHNDSAFLKPVHGSQGRRVIAYVRQPDGTVTLQGRYGDNRPFLVSFRSEQAAADSLDRWIGSRIYLMQPMLDLRDVDGHPFDLRALVQKNGKGRWRLTGIAARCGRPGTVTANLHGGGTSKPAEDLLTRLFGSDRADDLLQEIRDSCRRLVRRLEEHYGRFSELGLDFGVDRTGRLWFLEANSKPGRTAMAGIGKSAAVAAQVRPIAYARSILLRPHGRVIHEFDHL